MTTAMPNECVKSAESATGDAEDETLTLLSLPDLPLLRVLHYLEAADLLAAARASDRLCALTSTHHELWRGFKRFELSLDVDYFADTLRAIPVNQLEIDITPGCGRQIELLHNCRTLQIFNPRATDLTAMQILGPKLETLSITVMVLSGWSIDPEASEAFRPLVEHCSGLRTLELRFSSSFLLPLLDSCSSQIWRLKVTAHPSLADRLVRLRGLRELCVDAYAAASSGDLPGLEAEDEKKLLAAICSLPLEKLDLQLDLPPITLLDTMKLSLPSSLTSLGIEFSSGIWDRNSIVSLVEVLQCLPRLRSLRLAHVLHPEVVDAIPATAIPSLEELKLDMTATGTDPEEESLEVVGDLVHRAPGPLHATVVQWSYCRPIRIIKHPAAEAASCPICGALDVLDGTRPDMYVEVL